MLGYYLCTFFGMIVGIVIAGLMHASHDADIRSEYMLSAGEKKLED